MIEILAVIDAPHFFAGIVLWDDTVTEAADIIKYMAKQRWSRDRVRAYCTEKGWTVTVVSQHERRDIVNSGLTSRRQPAKGSANIHE